MIEETISEEEEDVRGIGMDDVTDTDYIPKKRPQDGFRRVQEMLMAGNNEMQIKLEAIEEENQTAEQKANMNKKKLAAKRKDSDIPIVIPQMVIFNVFINSWYFYIYKKN